MKTIERSALLPYGAKQLFDLVNDIEAYPSYMDGCVGAEVLAREPEYVEARLKLSRAGVSHSFTTRNRTVDARHISLELVEGPFEQFGGEWAFLPLGEVGCKVSLQLKFKIRNAVFSAAAARLFDTVANDLVAALEKRARELYG